MCSVSGLLTRVPELKLTVFDLGEGMRPAKIKIGKKSYDYNLWGAVNSRKLYKKSAYWNMRFSAHFGFPSNAGATAIKEADVVFDVSSGDSFSDLYGKHRFYDDILPKLTTIEQGRRLVLLPQTYGPYKEKKSNEIAKKIVRESFHAWARDEHSFDVLKGLLGDDFDKSRHHSGVDLAFLMPKVSLPNCRLREWMSSERGKGKRLIGLNVSGLLYGNPEAAKSNYGFKADYESLIDKLIHYILSDELNSLVLIPHVEAGGFHDRDVGGKIFASLIEQYPTSVSLVPQGLDARVVKDVISEMDWFCGTRMHSTIAAISSLVPTVAIAYSLKTKGVFETCGQGGQVVDPREMGTEQLLAEIIDKFNSRSDSLTILKAEIPTVKARAERQMDEIAASVS